MDRDTIIRSLGKLSEQSEDIKSLLNDTVDGLVNKKIEFVDIVESLQNSLTHTLARERCVGTRFLADVLHLVSPSSINKSELKFLVAFFIDRMKDHHSVLPNVIYAYLALIKMENVNDEDVALMIHSVFHDVQCQSQIMSDRRNIYNFLKLCLLKRKEVLQCMSTEFITGFITSTDGEKDPRNLMLLFSLIPHVVKHLSLGSFVEDMFEVIAAYFPIDFVPPMEDPFGIQPNDLILGLRNCLSSTEEFAPYAIPLLLEKLESDLVSAKLDCLLCLQLCFDNYSSEAVRPHTIPIWVALRKEIVQGWSQDVEAEALLSLSALVSNLEKGPSSPEQRDCLNNFTSVVLMECISHLSNPEQRLMIPSANIMLAVMKNSSSVTGTVLDKALPILLGLMKTKREAGPLKTTLNVLTNYLRQAAVYDMFSQEGLSVYLEACFSSLHQELSSGDKSVRVASVRALKTISTVLTDDKKYLLSRSLATILMTSKEEPFRSEVVEGLNSLGVTDSAIMEDILNKIQRDHSDSEIENLKLLLDTLATLASFCHKLRTTWPILWGHTMHLMKIGNPHSIFYIQSFKKLIMDGTASPDNRNYLLKEFGVVQQLTVTSLQLIGCAELDSVNLLRELSEACQESVRRDNQLEVESLVRRILRLPSKDLVILSDEVEKALSQGLLNTSELLVYPLEGLTVTSKSLSDKEALTALFSCLLRWSLKSVDKRIKDTSSVLLAVLLNKVPSDTDLKCHLDDCRRTLLTMDHSSSFARTLAWIVKALIMRGHPESASCVKELQDLLLDDTLGLEAAECYRFILKDIPVFSLENGCRIRLLYKQCFFESHIESLVTEFKRQEGNVKLRILLAISHLLPHITSVILKGHISTLLPVLAQGLRCNQETVIQGTVSTLACVLTQSSDEVKFHVSTLVAPLIKLTTSSPMMIRLKSLECLEAIARLPLASVMPYRDEVVLGLRAALDDRKRSVRRTASGARSAWVLL